ncbi:Rho guanine nucleotide exchange factor 10-like protein [Takifugu flavidus]|uniref:Rho guanine nucleotide exchange factor 10-like protein n=1 Tax=Takifugu flavidus TaxID=433684 RepID=A0A5C6N6C9_9TELE|nr:Rho guanine nucleotide exchange factor 10-like protein [Takifugu flavidus]
MVHSCDPDAREGEEFLWNDSFKSARRSPPDISSLVPIGPKYTMKWSAPIQQVQVVEVGQEGSQNKETLFPQSGTKWPGGACLSGRNFMGPPRLYQELQELQHDLSVVEDVTLLVGTLQGMYQNLNTTVAQDWCLALQRLIRIKEEQIQSANKCRLRLQVPGRPDKSGRPVSFMVVLNTPSPLSKISWVNRLHLAKIALLLAGLLHVPSTEKGEEWLHQSLDGEKEGQIILPSTFFLVSSGCKDNPSMMLSEVSTPPNEARLSKTTSWAFVDPTEQREENSPGWFCGEDEGKVMARGCCPLLASHMSVFAMKSPDRKLQAALHNPVHCALLGVSAASTSLPQGYLWVGGGGDASHGQIEIFSLNRPVPRAVKSLLVGSAVRCLEYVPEPSPNEETVAGSHKASSGPGAHICVGLDDGSIVVYGSVDTAAQCLLTLRDPEGSAVLCLKHSAHHLFAALHNGTVMVYARSNGDSLWDAASPTRVCLGSEPVRALLVLDDSVWASCGNSVTVMDISSFTTQGFEVHPEPVVSVSHMVCAGGGVWMAFSEGSSIRLFHTETLELLQEINISIRSALVNTGPKSMQVSSLLICQGLLWVGTAQGLIITLPVPRLEGIPKITGKGMISLNAHCGPVDFLLATTSTLSPDLLKRDSVGDGPDSACGGEDRSDNSSQESLQQSGSSQGDGQGKGRGVLLQYRLRSTSGLPGRLLTALGDEASDSSLESLEHSVEDGSIYELSDDPDIWVKGRPCERDGGRRDRVISAAVISGGKGFRRLKGGATTVGTRTSGETLDNTMMVWQLPLTV